MNFLQLCQRVRLECGISGTGPSTVVSQTGGRGRVVTWTNEAWKDVQTAHRDWGWMRATASFTTVAGTGTYTLGTGSGTVGVTAANFGMWVPESSRNYLTATGTDDEVLMNDIDYEAWRNNYQYGALRTATARPIQVAVSPVKALCLGPIPVVGYTVTRDYFSAPDDLEVDGDTPGLPAQFHMIIVYGAMMMYASYESAPEVHQRAEREHYKLM